MQPLSFKAFASPKALTMSIAKRGFLAAGEMALGNETEALAGEMEELAGAEAAMAGGPPPHPSKYTRAPQWPHGLTSGTPCCFENVWVNLM